MHDLQKISRALLSVSDKCGIIDLAKTLHQHGCELISTGGTAKVLLEAGLPVTDISAVTGNPEAFGGRMKTISFQIESALLFDRERDAAEAAALRIYPIDMVVCNLYPFKQVLDKEADFDTLVENIDIGGPTMVRAAAKNFKYVSTITDPADYAAIIAELDQYAGATTYALRRQLMRKAFNHTADYDAMIAVAMDAQDGVLSYRLGFSQGWALRYGENAHQKATLYRQNDATQSLFDIEILHGKALSFNNMLDIQAAIETVRRLPQYACAVVKHNNPCGVCQHPTDPTEALRLAWASDPISAFGSIVSFNGVVSLATAQFLRLDAPRAERKFVEVIVAPDFDADALAYLQQHKDLRLLRYPINQLPTAGGEDLRFLAGSLLRQDADAQLYDRLDNKTEKTFDLPNDEALIAFGLNALAQIKSNAIVVVRRVGDAFQLLGMGTGQPNRLVATRLAIDKCRENLNREIANQGAENANTALDTINRELGKCILLSDAFFPFEDNVELAAEQGIRFIVQPGGSIRDKHVIDTCNRLGIAMLFSGVRHFKH
ncbi:MAG: bifunctional phosphoribosylaminoimidazolecarboxamide formyltransferase/IMP cyclohydrolase [Chitinophagales bacterium]|nr:bifunctional phosphoribosylaminoimidazolecarboxamide formyltransferase/IMP cyclohydrolase [Chitinophagales bacterium]